MFTKCPCSNHHACFHFLARMELEERKDRALFSNPRAYDALQDKWNSLFTNGYDIHGINQLGFRNGEYVLTPPEDPSERRTEPLEGGSAPTSPYALPPAPKFNEGTFGSAVGVGDSEYVRPRERLTCL